MKKKSRYIDFKQLKQLVSIQQVLEHYELWDDLEGEDDALSGYCPVCEGEPEDLFRVSLSRNCWNCFGDCSGGNILDLVAQMEECSIREAAVKMTGWFDIECSPPKRKSTRKTAKKSTKKTSSKSTRRTKPEEPVSENEHPPDSDNRALGFSLELDSQHSSLDDLCLSSETVDEFGLGYCAKGYLKGCVAFPIHNRKGEVVAYGGIIIDSDDPEVSGYKYPAANKFDPSQELFGLYHAVQRGQTDVIYLVRSPLDVFRAWHDDEISAVCAFPEPSAEHLGHNIKHLVAECLAT